MEIINVVELYGGCLDNIESWPILHSVDMIHEGTVTKCVYSEEFTAAVKAAEDYFLKRCHAAGMPDTPEWNEDALEEGRYEHDEKEEIFIYWSSINYADT